MGQDIIVLATTNKFFITSKMKILKRTIHIIIQRMQNMLFPFFMLFVGLIIILHKILKLSNHFYNKNKNIYTIGLDARLLHRKISGVERYIIQLILNLAKIDSKNNYIVLSTAKVNDIVSLPDNFELKILSKAHNPESFFRECIKMLLKRIDLYHLTWSDISLRHYLLLFLGDVSVVTIHDLILLLFPDYLSPNLRKKYKRLIKFSTRWAKQVIVHSEHTKKDLIRYLNVPPEKINVICLAAGEKFKIIDDWDIKRKVRNKYNLQTNFIFSLGKDFPHKNIISLVRAYHKLVEQQNIKHDLVLAGESVWGSSMIEIRNYIKNFGLERRVKLLGHIDDKNIPVLFNLATVFVFPSLYEGFGLPLVEAMACGVPIIAINTTSIPEVVENAGILVEAYDINGLASSIYQVLTDELLRKKLIGKGLERAKYFSEERMAKQTLSVYYKALEKEIISV